MTDNFFTPPEEILEQAGQVGKQTAKTVTDTTKQVTQGIVNATLSQIPGLGTAEQGSVQTTTPHTQTQGLNENSQNQQSQMNQLSQQTAQTPEEQQQLADARMKLEEEKKKAAELQKFHMEHYYKPTFEEKPKQQAEERPAEKLEKEKKMEELEQKKKDEKKPPPLDVQRAQQRAEKFPGASG